MGYTSRFRVWRAVLHSGWTEVMSVTVRTALRHRSLIWHPMWKRAKTNWRWRYSSGLPQAGAKIRISTGSPVFSVPFIYIPCLRCMCMTWKCSRLLRNRWRVPIWCWTCRSVEKQKLLKNPQMMRKNRKCLLRSHSQEAGIIQKRELPEVFQKTQFFPIRSISQIQQRPYTSKRKWSIRRSGVPNIRNFIHLRSSFLMRVETVLNLFHRTSDSAVLRWKMASWL